MTTIAIDLPLEEIQAYCQNQPIQRLWLFGSVLRTGDFDAESDIDMLVEYRKGIPITLLDMAQQELDLIAIVGRQIDLRTPSELSSYFREAVLETAVLIYDRD